MQEKVQLNSLGRNIENYSKEDQELIKKALLELEKLNETNFKSDEKVNENIQTGIILTELRAAPTTIAAALLCSKRLTEKDFQEIKNNFLPETTFLIESKIKFENAIKSEKKIEGSPLELRKLLFFSLLNNHSLILFVLADRLSLLRKIDTLSEEDKKDLLLEQKEILIPIAHKLGVYNIKSEAEDIIFKHDDPKKYQEIIEKSEKETRSRKKEIERITAALLKEAKEKNLHIKISGRAKSAFSTYKKMLRKNKKLEEIYDIIALRIICESVKDCYELLGVVHSLWKPIPEEFNDFITKPKENNYQALHTTILGIENKAVEIQIKTKEMNHNAEIGLAAHWKYKGHQEQKILDKKIGWLHELLSWRKELKTAPSRIAQVDFFGDKVYVLSPKGDIIELPQGATVLDYAYAIHDDLGNKCIKAKINQKLVPLNQKLESADIIEIITSFSQKPKMHWLNFVVTTKAKNSIKEALNLNRFKKATQTITPKEIIKTTDKRIRIALCCRPLPGDKIVGFKTTKRKISVHRADCKEVLKFNPDQQQIISWDNKSGPDYSVELQVLTKERPGILQDILEIFSDNKITVINANANLKGDTTHCIFRIETKNLKELENTIEKIRKTQSVISVQRI